MYHFNDSDSKAVVKDELNRTIEEVAKHVNSEYEEYLVEEMPYNLEGLSNVKCSIAYNAEEGKYLRNSRSAYENASFLI